MDDSFSWCWLSFIRVLLSPTVRSSPFPHLYSLCPVDDGSGLLSEKKVGISMIPVKKRAMDPSHNFSTWPPFPRLLDQKHYIAFGISTRQHITISLM